MGGFASSLGLQFVCAILAQKLANGPLRKSAPTPVEGSGHPAGPARTACSLSVLPRVVSTANALLSGGPKERSPLAWR